jgi:hypothetical protein
MLGREIARYALQISIIDVSFHVFELILKDEKKENSVNKQKCYVLLHLSIMSPFYSGAFKIVEKTKETMSPVYCGVVFVVNLEN